MMNANEAIDILNDCYDSEIGGYCGRSQEVAKFIQSLQAENDRLRKVEEKAIYTKDWLLALCEECCHYVAETKICSEEGKIPCDALEVVKALENSLKGGAE